jgi:hypothetical protein
MDILGDLQLQILPILSNTPINYLEIGVYNKENVDVTINTYNLQNSKLYFIDISGIQQEHKEHKEHIIIIGSSHIEIPKLSDDFFDVIRINRGNHECVLEDAVLSFRKLKKGGLMIIDDYGWGGIDGFLYGYHNVILFLGLYNNQGFIENIGGKPPVKPPN